jgi:uncharacterized membrane protein YuzA (DUF378 family)
MLDKWLHMFAIVLVVVGALNWGLIGFTGQNAVTALLGKGFLANTVYGLIGIAAAFVAFRRDTFLPFLGETVMPCSILENKTPEHADTEVVVDGLEPGAKLLFWAAEPETSGLTRIQDWRQAYLKFANAGVATANQNGVATLRIRKPQPYTVPVKGRIETHVHWRVCGNNGMLGPVQLTLIP